MTFRNLESNLIQIHVWMYKAMELKFGRYHTNSISVKLVARRVLHYRLDGRTTVFSTPSHHTELTRNWSEIGERGPSIFRFPASTTPAEPLPAMEKRRKRQRLPLR
jgi:hypothetical protein